MDNKISSLSNTVFNKTISLSALRRVFSLKNKNIRTYYNYIPKRVELPIKVCRTGGSGPARVWGHVKSVYSAGERTEWPPCLANQE